MSSKTKTVAPVGFSQWEEWSDGDGRQATGVWGVSEKPGGKTGNKGEGTTVVT